MEKRTKEILDEALALPESEREELVELLVPSLERNPYSGELHPDWIPEIERRLRDHREGKTKAIPWEEVKARLHREVFGD